MDTRSREGWDLEKEVHSESEDIKSMAEHEDTTGMINQGLKCKLDSEWT